MGNARRPELQSLLSYLKPSVNSGSWYFVTLAGAFFVACGGPGPDPSATEVAPVERGHSQVIATPSGHTFDNGAVVTLRSESGDYPTILYTTDGRPASHVSAHRYTEPIKIDRTTLLSFIAVARDGTWSTAGTELYVAEKPAVSIVPTKGSRIVADRSSVFFAWQPGQPVPVTAPVSIRVVGDTPLRIRDVGLVMNPRGWAFWAPDAFEIQDSQQGRLLAPGDTADIIVSYRPTETLRSAALAITVDGNPDFEGLLVELWGRVSAW